MGQNDGRKRKGKRKRTIESIIKQLEEEVDYYDPDAETDELKAFIYENYIKEQYNKRVLEAGLETN